MTISSCSRALRATLWLVFVSCPLSLVHGRLPDFSTSSSGNGVVIERYNGAVEVVVIPEQIDGKDVVGIDDRTFLFRRDITELHIPRTVTRMTTAVFDRLTKLAVISVDARNNYFRSHDGVLLDSGGFSVLKCPEAKPGTCTLPPSVQYFEQRAFQACHSLARIVLGPNVIHIWDGIFNDCPNLAAIDVHPDNAKFASQDGVLYLKDGATLIRHPRGKPGSFFLPATVTELHYGAFHACGRLVAIEVDVAHPALSSREGALYTKDGTMLIQCPGGRPGTFRVPATTAQIADAAFLGCVALDAIEVEPGGTFRSQDGLLYGAGFDPLIQCPRGIMGAVRIHDATRQFRSNAFEGCSKITSLYFGPVAEVPIFGSDVLTHLPSLTTIEVAVDNQWHSSFEGALYSKDRSTLLACPHAKAGTLILAEEAISIESRAFDGCSALTRVVVGPALGNTDPPAMPYFGGLFLESPLLEAVDIHPLNPNGSSRDGLVYNKEGTSLQWCPYGRSGEIVIPDSVTEILHHALLDCGRLTRVVIGEGVMGSLPSFGGCPGLTSLVIGQGMLDLGESWYGYFSDNPLLASIEVSPVHPSLSSVDGLLYDKSQTTLKLCPPGRTGHVAIADSATSLSYGAFNDCTELTSVGFGPNLGPSLEPWSNYFDYCPRLAAFDVDPLNATNSSRDGVLYNKDQTRLQFCPPARAGELIIPDSVTTVEIEAINGCPFLTRIVMGSGLTGAEFVLFRDCPGVTSFVIGQGYVGFATPDILISPTPPGLASIEVHPLNTMYSSVDGVLYNKERTTLIRCPPGRPGEVVVPDSVTFVFPEIFESCSQVTRVVIGNGVTYLPIGQFAGCSSLASLVIGAGVADLPSSVRSLFSQPSAVAAIEVHPSNLFFSSLDGVLYNKNRTHLLWWPPQKPGPVVVPAGVASLSAHAFDSLSGLDALYLEGDAPTLTDPVVLLPETIVFFQPGTQGWGQTFSGQPTAVWEPTVVPGSIVWDSVTGEFSFGIQWIGDPSVVVEAGSSLTAGNWAPVATVALESGTGTFRTTVPAGQPTQFYRLRRP